MKKNLSSTWIWIIAGSFLGAYGQVPVDANLFDAASGHYMLAANFESYILVAPLNAPIEVSANYATLDLRGYKVDLTTHPNEVAIRVTGRNITIRDGQLFGGRSGIRIDNDYNGDYRIEDMTIRDAAESGIQVELQTDSKLLVRDCLVDGTEIGLSTHTITSGDILDNIFTNCQMAMQFVQSGNVRIVGNVITEGTRGISFVEGFQCRIERNQFHNVIDSGLILGESSDMWVSDNMIFGVSIGPNSEYCVFDANHFVPPNSLSTPQYPDAVSNFSHTAVFSNNHFFAQTGIIDQAGGSHVDAGGNQFH